MERLESRETPAQFFGGVRIASADVTGDNVADIIAAAGPGGGPHIRVMNGATGAESLGFYAFPESFRGGVFVAAGDMTGDGVADIVAGAGEGGDPLVRIFNGRTGAQIAEFLAFPQGFTGGVRVAVGDVTGDGRADIIAAAGPGGSPLVRVFDGVTRQQVNQFFAFAEGFTGGVFVAAGDVNGDGRDDIVVGAGAGGSPNVRVLSGLNTATVLKDFLAFDPRFRGGVTVAAGNYSSTARADIIVGAGPGGGPHVKVFNSQTDAVANEFLAYAERFRGGVFVAVRDLNNNAADDILTGAGPGGTAHVRALHDNTLIEIAGFNAYEPAIGPGIAFAVPIDTTPDTTAPTVTITTPQPTAPVSTNPTITGTVTDNRPGTLTLTAQVNGGAVQPVSIGPGGAFSFTTNLALDGSADGQRTVTFIARDAAGNASTPRTFTFTLQTQAVSVTLNLAPESEGTTPGNNRTNLANVALAGVTSPGATVSLVGTAFTTTADAQGNYRFANVPLQVGVNSFTARASINNRTGEVTRLIVRNSTPTVAGPVGNLTLDANPQATILNLPTIFSDLDINSLIRFNTSAGPIDIELFDQQTPRTVQNLLAYIAQGSYTSSIFHRSVADFVLQGGGFVFRQNPNRLDSIVTSDPVQNEPGISNQPGTIAMAKLGGDPNSATSQFFFNLVDNSRGGPSLDTQNGGFTAFGTVRGNGFAIVNQLASIPVQNRGGVFSEIPLQNYPAPPAGNFPTDTTSANYAFISDVEIVRRSDSRNGDALVFSVVSNSNSSLVTAAIVGGRLTLTYAAGQTGRATITLRATDLEGEFVETTFTVNVGVPDDTTPPEITITEPPQNATVSTNPTIRGTVIDDVSGIFTFTASVDGAAPVPVTVAGDGSWQFTTNFPTDGTQDGLHTVVFAARDQAGNEATPLTYIFTLDSAVSQLTFDLDNASDTAGGGIAGNQRTILDTVSLVGSTEAGATVELVGTGRSTTADASGNFTFADVPLELGVNKLTIRATDTGGNTRELTRSIIRTSDPTVAAPVGNFAVDQNAIATILNLPTIFSDVEITSLVRFTTPAGTFDMETFEQFAPTAVKNFLDAVAAGEFDNSIFHRSLANVLLQGGGFRFVAGPPASLANILIDGVIANEPVLSNQLGTVGLPRQPGTVDRPVGEFFFNLADNSRGDQQFDTINGGFTVFGVLRGDALSVIQSLAAIGTQDRGGRFADLPLQNYPQPPDGDFPGDTTPANYAFLNSIAILRRSDQANGDTLTFSIVENTNPGLVTAVISNGKLTLNYAANQSGRATITLRAADAEGRSVETTFTVTVGNVEADPTPPVVTISTPQPAESITGNIDIDGTVTDVGSGVLFLRVLIDGAPAGRIDFSNTGSFRFTTTFALDGSQDGPHILTFIARDVAGNESDPVNFAVDLRAAPPLPMKATPTAQSNGDGESLVGDAGFWVDPSFLSDSSGRRRRR